ncbi:MAG: hypothetical protein PHT33_04475 [bacterium]|nr:hypothetical protein [bacterium]
MDNYRNNEQIVKSVNFQHKNLAAGAWQKLSFFEQMANVGSEVIRAMNWKRKGNPDYSQGAFERALELLFLTIDDPANKTGARLKELTRLYEVLVDYFAGDNLYDFQEEPMERYFLAFTYTVRRAQ